MTVPDRLAAALKSRNGALAGAAAALVLVFVSIALPLAILFQAQDAKTKTALQELGRLRAQAAIEPLLRNQLTELRKRAASAYGIIPERSGALAQSQLQQVMESFAKQIGASIRSSQMLSSAPQHGFEPVAIQYELTVPMSKLQDLVYAIETHVPYLFLNQIQISGTESGRPANSISGDTPLNVGWSVTAYRHGNDR